MWVLGRMRCMNSLVELGSGQSFAIAGLLQDSSTRTNSGLPAVGSLFGSTSYQVAGTELVVLVTPVISRPVDDPAALHVSGEEAVAAAVPASVQRAGLPSGTGFIVQ